MNLKYPLLLALFGFLTACQQPADDKKPEKKATERPAHTVEVVTLAKQPTHLQRTLTGTLEAPRTVHIHSEQAGRILELPYFEGDKVAADALLARLDDALIRTELDMAIASRKQTELDLQRLQNLVPKQLATEDELARARTALELARAAETLQRTRLSHATITAPFAGIISERLKEPGDAVPVNEHLLTLFDPTLITAAVRVPEQILSQLAEGTTVTLSIDSLGDQTFPAKILRIHPQVDPATRQGTVEIRLQPVPMGARPGQLCRVTIETPPTPRRVIPLNALQYDTQGAYVFRLSDEAKVQRVAVRTGLQLGETVEILDGLADGDQVVVKGFLDLRAGKKVQIVNAKKPAAKASKADKPAPQE